MMDIIRHSYSLFTHYCRAVVFLEQQAGLRHPDSSYCRRERDNFWNAGPRNKLPYEIEFIRLQRIHGAGTIEREIDIRFVLDVEAARAFCVEMVGPETDWEGFSRLYRRNEPEARWFSMGEEERKIYVGRAKERMRALYGEIVLGDRRDRPSTSQRVCSHFFTTMSLPSHCILTRDCIHRIPAPLTTATSRHTRRRLM